MARIQDIAQERQTCVLPALADCGCGAETDPAMDPIDCVLARFEDRLQELHRYASRNSRRRGYYMSSEERSRLNAWLEARELLVSLKTAVKK